MKKVVFCSVLMMFSAAFAAPDCNSDATYPEITKTELQTSIDKKTVTVVDVNGTKSYTKSHIPTAIDYKANPKGFATKLPADKSSLVVAYCGGPSCVAWKEAAVAACNMGYTNIKHFKPGISGWNGKI